MSFGKKNDDENTETTGADAGSNTGNEHATPGNRDVNSPPDMLPADDGDQIPPNAEPV